MDAVKSGAIKHFFLVGGCDGARPGRNYYTEFVKADPRRTRWCSPWPAASTASTTSIWATIGGLPRLMDMGQCNDAYSAIQVAVALAEAFGCGVNDLPLSMVLSWYEQKAVCILLTLLYLGIQEYLASGPRCRPSSPPAFSTSSSRTTAIAPTTTPEADLAELLGE